MSKEIFFKIIDDSESYTVRKVDTAMLVSGSLEECMAVVYMKSMRAPFM